MSIERVRSNNLNFNRWLWYWFIRTMSWTKLESILIINTSDLLVHFRAFLRARHFFKDLMCVRFFSRGTVLKLILHENLISLIKSWWWVSKMTHYNFIIVLFFKSSLISCKGFVVILLPVDWIRVLWVWFFIIIANMVYRATGFLLLARLGFQSEIFRIEEIVVPVVFFLCRSISRGFVTYWLALLSGMNFLDDLLIVQMLEHLLNWLISRIVDINMLLLCCSSWWAICLLHIVRFNFNLFCRCHLFWL